ncbi:hypothetical protein F2P56_004332 [Juglans regia]|uniref:Transcription elongation factor TFIIS-like n=2 Tax=Juglans regia TaxID=51240 RepID=A0A2I4GAE9_JUGRE|nr:transcription elongation factor TFIIS-like [Juglans regia]KAF5477715.1 hypothetical protein F2P56_004332 [Juglans regia]
MLKAYCERVRKQLEDTFSGVASEADEGIRHDVEACDSVQVATSIESAIFLDRSCQRCLWKEKASTDMFKCERCGEHKCSYYQMQTRSADESMTTYVTCVNCNNHWKL